jgi:uncharacterized BrkB/YihY/UPF0761 family membrane protein
MKKKTQPLRLEPVLQLPVQLSLPLIFEEEVKEVKSSFNLNWYETGGYANLALATAFFAIWGMFALLYHFVPAQAPSEYDVTRFGAIILAFLGLSLIRNEIADIFCKLLRI